MAMRASGGTGVLVALIIFIFLTVGCAAAAILLYGQKNNVVEEAQRARADLAEIMTGTEQDREDVKSLKAEASTNRKSLVGHLLERSQGYRTFVVGDPNADESTTRSRFNIPDNKTLAEAFNRTIQERDMLKSSVNELESRVADMQSQLGNQRDQYAQLKTSKDEEVNEVHSSISGYRTAAEQYRDDTSNTQDEYRRSIDQNNELHRNEVAILQEEIDDLNGNQTVLSSRLNELRKVVDAIRIRPKNPAELVDGRVIDVLGSSGQVFIDLGRQDRIRPGMTFEVYDNAGQIRVDSNSGEYSRGKASLQVIKVADTTATARVTRTSGARPVVRDDVVANAVFNPQYRFKFLVFGKFDVDGNGSPTETEADFIRSLIIEWGGEVVEGNQLTGDLDFVVLGDVPQYVPTELIPNDASPAEIDAILKKREAYDHYEELFQQAINAQIPVLNWNRFRILTGESDS